MGIIGESNKIKKKKKFMSLFIKGPCTFFTGLVLSIDITSSLYPKTAYITATAYDNLPLYILKNFTTV